MLGNSPKISILVITYNQEDVISRAIESLLSQKDYIYEICVSDDCSKDRTWDILQDYYRQYPSLFKLNRNTSNIGIFENIEKTWEMPSGDFIYQLSGDDECGTGWLKKVYEFIEHNTFDFAKDFISIYGDYVLLYPNGDKKIFRNNLVGNKDLLVKYSLLGLIGNRSCCYSINILKHFQKVSKGRSHEAETAQEIQLPLFTHGCYYISYIGNVYHAGEGVSSHLSEEDAREREQIVPYAFNLLEENNYKISRQERLYCTYNCSLKQYKRKRTCLLFVKSACAFFLTYSYSYKIFKKNVKNICFSILHKIKHHFPIIMTI